jgi:hypothetical protein
MRSRGEQFVSEPRLGRKACSLSKAASCLVFSLKGAQRRIGGVTIRTVAKCWVRDSKSSSGKQYTPPDTRTQTRVTIRTTQEFPASVMDTHNTEGLGLIVMYPIAKASDRPQIHQLRVSSVVLGPFPSFSWFDKLCRKPSHLNTIPAMCPRRL